MRLSIVALLLLPRCGAPQLRAATPAECPLAVPPDAGRFVDLDSVGQLAGDYRLIQIAWQPSPSVTRGYLHLEVPDSAWREVPCGLRKMKRDLIGSYRLDDAVPGPWTQALASPDPAHPGVTGQGSSVRIGMQCMMDGGGDDLFITAVSPQGFWGNWSSDLGIAVLVDSTGHKFPNPAGFFCAIRQQDSTATSP
jgi:hypothetical protein